MIKILAVSPLKFDGTSYYRAWGVFKDLATRVDIEVTDYVQRGSGWSWPDFVEQDIIFLQRPGTLEHHTLARYCRDLGRNPDFKSAQVKCGDALQVRKWMMHR